MDFIELPKDKKGYDYALVVLDRFSKRCITILCHKTVTSKDVARLLLQNVVCYNKLPDSIVSDRDRMFVSRAWEELCRILKIKHSLSTAYHPQSDGGSERMVKSIKQRLRVLVNLQQDDWSDMVYLTDIAQAALPQESTGMSSFKVKRGYEMRLSTDLDREEPELVTSSS